MTPLEFLACFLIMAVGGLLHGSVGFGLALVTAPFLLLINPAFVPAPIILTSVVLVSAMLIRERHAIDLHGIWWAVAGCAVGTAAASVLLTLISESAFQLLFGVMILAAVALSLVKGMSDPSRGVVFGAGALSGLMGTTTSLGGPPLAIVYQGSSGPQLRATMSGYFIAASFLAIVGLVSAGRLGMAELELAGYLTPGMLAGLVLSNYTRHWLKPRQVKPVVLILSGAAAAIILLRYFSNQ